MSDDNDTPGLTKKFNVTRVDPSAQERHPDCQYFVLDIDHDPFAKPALQTYADAVADEQPALAEDLRRLASPPIDQVAVERGSLNKMIAQHESIAASYEEVAQTFRPGTLGRSANLAEAAKYHGFAGRYYRLLEQLERDTVCPDGCGCRKGTNDAEADDCACGGPCQHDPAYTAPESSGGQS